MAKPEPKLSALFTLDGVGAASGLFFDGRIRIISDKGAFLYTSDIDGLSVQKSRLVPGDEFLPKDCKPDFESVCFHAGKLHVFGSGSTGMRMQMATFEEASGVVQVFDLSPLYAAMQKVSGIPAREFNIEGVCFLDQWKFFQRGNGPSGHNGMFTFKSLSDFTPILYQDIALPEIRGVRFAFTDAATVDRHIWFLASAEHSGSVYDDGAVMGSLIGKMDAGGKIISTWLLSEEKKFEGLTLFRKTHDTTSFLVCEDDDSDAMRTPIFRLDLKNF